MNIRDLKYLVALADHRHFGKAAEICFVSQPALSMQIKKLEEILGVKLLERTNKSVLLTDCGMTITERARQILDQVEEIKEIAKSASDPYSGELKLGIFPTIAPYLLPHILPPLSNKFPKVSFYLIEEKTDLLLEKLKKGEIHAAIIAIPVFESWMTVAPLFEEEFLLVVPHSHTLSKNKNISQNDINHKKILLLDETHCMRNAMLNFCNQMNLSESSDFRATSLETLRNMVAAGAGITLMPKLSSEGCDLATYIPFNHPKPTRSIGLVYRSSTTKQMLLHATANHIKMVMKKKKSVTVLE